MTRQQQRLEDTIAQVRNRVKANILKAQAQQKRNYDRRNVPSEVSMQLWNVLLIGIYYYLLQQPAIGDQVLKRNLKRSDRKGGKHEERWMGPYEVRGSTPRGLLLLRKNGRDLKQAVNPRNIKPFFDAPDDDDNDDPDPDVSGYDPVDDDNDV
jgi:hypothetical protein